MKRLLITVAALTVSCCFLTAQTNDFEYSYSPNGNRVQRKLIVYKSAQSNNPETTDTATNYMNELRVAVFPNPTMGNLEMEISNLSGSEQGYVVLYDLNGKPLFRTENLCPVIKMDIGSKPAGSYILQLVIGDQKKEWRVVKE